MPNDARKPTPTPWKLQDCSNGGKLILLGDLGKHPQSHVQIVPAEDAELIVKAVNAHDKLVEARARDISRRDKTCTCKDPDFGHAICPMHGEKSGNEPPKGVMPTDPDQTPVGTATPPTGVEAGASVGAQLSAEQFWPEGIEYLEKVKHWDNEQIMDMFGTIVCEFAEAYASKITVALAAELEQVKAERDRLRDMYNEQMRLKDEYKGFFRAAEAQLAEAIKLLQIGDCRAQGDGEK